MTQCALFLLARVTITQSFNLPYPPASMTRITNTQRQKQNQNYLQQREDTPKMPLFKIPNFGLGRLRTKLARAAKRSVKSTRYGSYAATITPTPSTEGRGQPKIGPLQQPSSVATASKSISSGMRPIFTTEFPIRRPALIIVSTPIENATQLGGPEVSPAVSEVCSQIGMTPLEQPWFSRRRSSLMRISVSNMQMSDEITPSRSSASQQYEDTPPALDRMPVTSEGIQMEMNNSVRKLSVESRKVSFEDLNDADAKVSVLTFEYVSFLMVHHANPRRFTPASERRLSSAASTSTSPEASAHPEETSNIKKVPPQSHPCPVKLRPAPLPISDAAFTIMSPVPVQDHFCVISDSPLSFQSMAGAWPDTPHSIRIVLRPGTARSSLSLMQPGTADSDRSEFQSVCW